jgi:RNA-directed DNA polymerase
VIANVALSVLDEHFVASRLNHEERAKRRRRGLPNYRLIRYADDWCLAVSGTREQAQALRTEAAEVLSTMGLRLSPEKTLITHIDEGLDFLGWRIQRHRKRGTTKHYVYNYPAKKALRAVTAKIKTLCWQDKNLPLAVLLHRLNPMLRGWTAYFRYGCSSKTFNYVRAYLWQRVFGWLRRKHPKTTWKQLRRYTSDGWWPAENKVTLFNPAEVSTRRYLYRGTKIPSPWPIGA